MPLLPPVPSRTTRSPRIWQMAQSEQISRSNLQRPRPSSPTSLLLAQHLPTQLPPANSSHTTTRSSLDSCLGNTHELRELPMSPLWPSFLLPVTSTSSDMPSSLHIWLWPLRSWLRLQERLSSPRGSPRRFAPRSIILCQKIALTVLPPMSMSSLTSSLLSPNVLSLQRMSLLLPV